MNSVSMYGGVLATALAAALAAMPAQAQETAANDPGLQLQEVVVTAEKRSENIQHAPAAITSISGDDLIAVGAPNIAEMSALFPSARFENIFGWAHMYVRGIGAEQDRVTVDQLVNVFTDGVVLPREMVASAQNDLDAIELLPGPQGTLYGLSSVGGVLNIRNARPTHDDYNKLSLEAGNYGEFHIRDVQNVDVNEQLALRASIDYLKHNAYETTGRWTANTGTARLAALWTPSDSFSAYIWAMVYNDDSISPESGVTTADGQWIPRGNPWDTLNDCATIACNGSGSRQLKEPQTGVSHDHVESGQFDWHLNGFTISDIISDLRVDMNEKSSPWIFTGFLYQAYEHQITNELKVSSDSANALQWLAGLYLYQNKADSQVTFAGYQVKDYTLQNFAPYAQLTYSFNDQLRVIAGARYSYTKKEATFIQPNALPETSANWSNVDWKLGLEYDLNPATLLYLTAQTGSSPGTLDQSNVTADGRPTATKLTKLSSLTAGWKSELFNHRLQLNNEVWYYDYKDFLIQTVICGSSPSCFPLNTVFLNAPKMTSVGDELNVRWLVTAHDTLNIGAAFTEAKTGHWVTDAGANLSHQTLMEAPQTTISLGAQHAFSMANGGETIFRVDTYFSGGYWADFETDPSTPVHLDSMHQAAYTTTNVALTYHAPNDRWSLGLWGRNLEDKAQLGPGNAFGAGSYQNVAGIALISGIPRTYGVQFNMKMDTGSK